MARNIIGVIVGYIVMALFIFISFTILYAILGTENSFQPGSFEVSGTWIVFSFLLGIVAALLGGLTCILISKNQKAVLALAGIVLILGLIMAIPTLSGPESSEVMIRSGDVGGMDAMQKAITPSWISFLNPIIGAVFVYLGARLRKEKKSSST